MAKKPYKDIMGRYRTQSLFVEKNTTKDEFTSPWTLKDQDHTYKDRVYPSLKRIYIDMEDPTEYNFALATLGSWEHWEVLNSREWFKPHLDAWRAELDIKLQAKAVATIQSIAADGDDSRSLQAARYLANKGYLDKNSKGRPSKDEIARVTKRLAHKQSELDDDAERIGLSKIY